MLEQFTTWLVSLVRAWFDAIWTFFSDLFIAIVKMVTDVLVWLLQQIPVPSFMSGGLGSLFGDLSPGILWALTAVGLPQGLAIIGAGYVFRLVRKVVTVFQW